MKLLISSLVFALGLATVLWQLSREAEPLMPPPREVPAQRSPGLPVVAAPRLPAVLRAAPAPLPEPRISERVEVSPEAEGAAEGARLQTRFAGEPADPTWATVARPDLTADLGRVGSNEVRIESIACRASLCRAELIIANAAAGRAFLEAWLRQRTSTGPVFAAPVETRPDGVPHLIVFLGRPGAELARVE
jgi:hypothetical protein